MEAPTDVEVAVSVATVTFVVRCWPLPASRWKSWVSVRTRLFGCFLILFVFGKVMSNSAIEWTWQGLRVEAPLDHTDTTFSFWHVLISLHVYIYLHITYLFILYMPYIGRNYETPVWIMSLLQKVNRYVRVYRYKYIYIYILSCSTPLLPVQAPFFRMWRFGYVSM